MKYPDLLKNGLAAWLSITIIAMILFFCLVQIDLFDLEDSAHFGDSVAGLLAPIIGVLTIYLIVETYQKQHESQDLQEKSINFQALNQLIQELDQQKPEIVSIIKKCG